MSKNIKNCKTKFKPDKFNKPTAPKYFKPELNELLIAGIRAGKTIKLAQIQNQLLIFGVAVRGTKNSPAKKKIKIAIENTISDYNHLVVAGFTHFMFLPIASF